MENIVYNELIYLGYEVFAGKTRNSEINFVAKKDGITNYIQVIYEMYHNESAIEREFGAFKTIDDNYPKYVISLDKVNMSPDGINHINLIDFLLNENLD